MTTRIGINGFGRIGRSVFRVISRRSDMEVVAINDLYENEQLAYLLQYDTVMGRFEHPVEVDESAMYVDGRKIIMTAERDPRQIGWGKLGVDVVIESTGAFRHREKIEKHLAGGAQRVVLTVPAKDAIDATIVMGVNEETLGPDDRIVSNASCTTNCLAPLAKVLDDSLGIEEGLLTTIHAYTNDQRLADVPHRDLRRSRAAAQNVIPTTTGAAKAVGKVMPHLDGKLDGIAIRVPVPDGSIVDFVCKVQTDCDAESVNATLREAAEGGMRNIMEYSEAALVSSDIIGNPHSSIIDSLSTTVEAGRFVNVVAWYDNEWGYSNRVVDLIEHLVS